MITAAYRINQTLEFRGAAHLLHWLAESALKPSDDFRRGVVERLHLGKPDQHGAYWLRQETSLELSEEDYAHVYRVLKRYRAFCQHMREVDPEWRDGEKVPYMDNSVELTQHSVKYPGLTRKLLLVGPHGDAC